MHGSAEQRTSRAGVSDFEGGQRLWTVLVASRVATNDTLGLKEMDNLAMNFKGPAER